MISTHPPGNRALSPGRGVFDWALRPARAYIVQLAVHRAPTGQPACPLQRSIQMTVVDRGLRRDGYDPRAVVQQLSGERALEAG